MLGVFVLFRCSSSFRSRIKSARESQINEAVKRTAQGRSKPTTRALGACNLARSVLKFASRTVVAVRGAQSGLDTPHFAQETRSRALVFRERARLARGTRVGAGLSLECADLTLDAGVLARVVGGQCRGLGRRQRGRLGRGQRRRLGLQWE